MYEFGEELSLLTDSKKKKPIDEIRESNMTYDLYAAMPDDGNRYEIDDGVLELMSPGPNTVHQLVLQAIQELMLGDCREDYLIILAPLDVILSQREVKQPDMIMVHKSRTSIVTYRGIEGPPDLVVEVSSEYSLRRDRVKKAKSYAKYGVPEYWIVDIANMALEQYVLREAVYELVELYREDDVVHSQLLACVSFSMNDVLRSIPYMPPKS